MSTSLTCARLTVCTIAAVVIQIIGLLVFVLGFFPVKPALSGISGPESFHSPVCPSAVGDHNYDISSFSPQQLKSLYWELSDVPPSFDRLIFMVVDGLPAEFVLGKDDQPLAEVFGEAMPYTQSLLAKGMAIGYHSKAEPPTVTMPRLKAMVSGSISGFLDVAFNFNSQALLDDNLIGQFLKIGWKMVMLGDETWLKLFPGSFTRQDGVSSFFVKDTVQVDHNVSRHLGDELVKTDWKLLILHYLGLDHVGHTGGRNSALMGPKLREMDQIIEKINLDMVQTRENNGPGRTLLMVVSDHGMTENGNHGGSSYEESDSLILLIGLGNNDFASTTHKTVKQVDIAPTLALLFGVPIPKNNAGVVIADTLHSLTEDQQLRALQLNSWQLFRLLQAQLPDLSCDFLCGAINDGYETSTCDGSSEDIFCCLYVNAAALHQSWISSKMTRSNTEDHYSTTLLAYHDFLRAASEWLSRRATDKPVGLLAFGVTAMLVSCLLLFRIIYHFGQEVCSSEKSVAWINDMIQTWDLDKKFILAIILLVVLSMGSSSLIEEEQYTWHFLTSTLYVILLRKSLQSVSAGSSNSPISLIEEQNNRRLVQFICVLVILICGRILRGWHQGGVNWTHLPDISKWLEKGGATYIKSSQLISVFLTIMLSFYALCFIWSKRRFSIVIGLITSFPGLLVLQHIIKYQNSEFPAPSYGGTQLVQLIYASIGTSAVGIVIVLPWIMPIGNPYICSSNDSCSSKDVPTYSQNKGILAGITDSIYVIGLGYIICWCLLQLLLQQPVNSVPVAAIFYLGMTGHFALGNTNTLATIDVAGAFMGLSSHSTILSGILMFIITYASPMLALLGMLLNISLKCKHSNGNPQDVDLQQLLKMTLGYPCLVPLGLNSILLVAYTIILLLMRNHLFVWSVFSPKFMYVCATTACIYVGVLIVASTVFYTFTAFALRRMLQAANPGNDSGTG